MGLDGFINSDSFRMKSLPKGLSDNVKVQFDLQYFSGFIQGSKPQKICLR